jgi:replicative DNA helicase
MLPIISISSESPYGDETNAVSGLPHSRDAEEAVIGSVLIDPEVFNDLIPLMTAGPNEFYIHRLRFIWESFERLSARKCPIDSLTVSEELDDMGRLDEIGGSAYLTALLNQVPTTLHAEAYAQIMISCRIRRDLLSAANKIATLAYDQSLDITQATTDAVSAVTKATEGAVTGVTCTAQEVFSQAYNRLDLLSRQPADALPGIPTGLIDVDRILGGGLQKGRLYTIAGRPGQGKTAFLLSAAHHASFNRRYRGVFFSLEMSNDELADRLLAMDQKIDGQKISTGKIGDEDWPSIVQGIENGSNAPLLFDDTPGLTPLQLLAKCKRIQASMRLDYVMLDYLGLMSVGKHTENRVQEVSYISRTLKQIARELKVPLFAAHQLSREVERRGSNEPQLSDLRDSGSIEQDSDCVMFLYQGEQVNVSNFKVAKQRNGPTGFANLIFRRNYTKFESAVSIKL